MKHAWDLSPKEAVALQREFADKIELVPLTKEPKLVGGCDVSMDRFAKHGFAGFVTLSFPELSVVDHAVVQRDIPFPYVPGLLSFREIPMLLAAWEKLQKKPDVLIADGVGIAHPRRLGIASHLGLLLDMPTIGCAKSVLTGVYDEPANEPGSISDLRDSKTGEVIGAAMRTKKNVKPIFISPGQRITLAESVRWYAAA